MNLLLDSNALQARAHLQDGKRLETFLFILRSLPGYRISFSPVGLLTDEVLADQDVLVITTRKWKDAHYSSEEIACIVNFVKRGGGLLLMSNHGDVPGRYPLDMTKSDAVLARQFGIKIETTFFTNLEPNNPTKFTRLALPAVHPIICGGAGDEPICSVVTQNCCSIAKTSANPFIFLSNEMIDLRNGYSPEGSCFATALDTEFTNRPKSGGRVVVIADSGFIGTDGTNFPGPGLIGQGDNRRLIQNIVRWLGREL